MRVGCTLRTKIEKIIAVDLSREDREAFLKQTGGHYDNLRQTFWLMMKNRK